MAISEPRVVDPGSRRESTRLAWAIFGVGILGLVASFVFRMLNDRSPSVADITQSFAFLATGVAGLAIAVRRRENAVGWVYLGIWLAVGVIFAFGGEYGYWATITHPGAPAGTFAVWLNNWGWVPVFGVLFTWTFLLFPDGHLPSPRWRPVGWASAILTILWSVAFAMEGARIADRAVLSQPRVRAATGEMADPGREHQLRLPVDPSGTRERRPLR